MSQCNVEFFNRNLELVHHDICDSYELSIDDDYLSAGNSSFDIAKTKVSLKNGFIRITGGTEFFGIVSDTEDSEFTTKVSFEPFIYLFSQNVLFDTDTQNKTALETVLKNLINKYWTNNSDAKQKLSYLTVSTTSSTTTWGMNLKSDKDNLHHAVVSLHDTLMVKALSKYGIAVVPTIDFKTKKITLKIGTNNKSFIIDADLPNVTVETFELEECSNSTNKLEIWDSEDVTTVSPIYYYVHTDHSYSTKDSDRITPVVLGVKWATPEYTEDSSTGTKTCTKTFAQAASEVASDEFSGMEWTNLIELRVNRDDTLVKPFELEIGETVSIIYEGKQYNTILTGKQIEETVLLQFGTVRKEYTKQIRLNK